MSDEKINLTYFNVSLIPYSSFFVEGLQRAAQSYPSRQVEFKIQHRMEFKIDIKCLAHICVFHAQCGIRSFIFLIDARDRSSVSHSLSTSDDSPFPEICRLYFKVNFREARDQEIANSSSPKILPLAPFFGLRPSCPWRLVNFRSGPRRMYNDMTDLMTLPALSGILGLRGRQKSQDVVFLSAYYRHPDHKIDNEYRLELIERVRRDRGIKGIAYFAALKRSSLPTRFRNFSGPYLPVKRLLQLYAESNLGVYVRGLHDCYSYKLPQYMALGLPIVGQPILRDGFEGMGVPGYREQFSYESPEEIVKQIKEALRHPAELHALGVGNMRFFDRAINPIAVGRQILREVVNEFESGLSPD
jgi:hypothetical protein